MSLCFRKVVFLLFYLLITDSASAHIIRNASVATSQTTSNGFNGVSNPGDAMTLNNGTYAEMYTWAGQAWLQLKYSNTLDPGTTSFIRVESIGYNLSSLIGDVITIEAYSNSTAISQGTLVATPAISIVQDANYTYLAVTPAVHYNSVRIKLSTIIQLPAYFLRVYYSFYNYSDGADCGKGWAASHGEKSLGAAPASNVQNPVRAVDADNNTYSTLQLAANQQNLEVSQMLYFPSTSYLANTVKITASVSSTFNTASHIITAQAYFGLTPVGTAQDISSYLSSANTRVDIYVTPGSFLDRVEISIRAKNNGSQAGHINIHEVQLVPEGPVLSKSEFVTCDGAVTLQVSNPNPWVQYRWYKNAEVLPETSTSCSPSLSPSATPYTIRVVTLKPNCSAESKAAEATVTINPKPATPQIAVSVN